MSSNKFPAGSEAVIAGGLAANNGALESFTAGMNPFASAGFEQILAQCKARTLNLSDIDFPDFTNSACVRVCAGIATRFLLSVCAYLLCMRLGHCVCKLGLAQTLAAMI